MSNPILKIPKEQLSGVETPCCQFAHLLTHHFVWNMVILADQLINLSEFGMCCLINITNSPWNFPPKKKHTNIFSYFNLSPTKKKRTLRFFSPQAKQNTQPPWRLLSIQASATRSGSFRRCVSRRPWFFGLETPPLRRATFSKCFFGAKTLGWIFGWCFHAWSMKLQETEELCGIVGSIYVHDKSWRTNLHWTDWLWELFSTRTNVVVHLWSRKIEQSSKSKGRFAEMWLERESLEPNIAVGKPL